MDPARRAWLSEAEPDPRAGGVSRLLFEVWTARADLQELYPDLGDATDRDGFLGWAVVHGTAEGLVPDWAAPPAPAHVDPASDAATFGLGVNVAGYFRSELGVGEAARRVVDALDAAQVPLLMVQGPTQPLSRQGHDADVSSTEAATFPLNLVCVNADGLPRFMREAGPAFAAGRTTIGMWWWELPDFPEHLHGAFAHVDELWAGTRYVQEALQTASPVPVVHVPVPVVAPSPPPMTRAQLGLPEGFLVLFAFDHNSVMERKNPLGLIEAYTRAFGPDDGAVLVIKSINADQHPEAHARLVAAAAQRDDVHVIDGYVSAAERDAMVAACDVYASLHRAEGFGLTLAEALALGKPVVATGWSGNVDFMTPETSWLVPYTLTDVGPGNEPYDAGGRWADPDLDAAASALREIREDPSAAAARGAAGAAWIVEHHAPAVVGAAMRARLEELHPPALARAAGHAEEAYAESRAAVEFALARVARGPEDFAPRGGNPLAAMLRRLVLKLTRAQAENQRAADEAVLAAVQKAAELSEQALRRAAADRRAAAHLTATVLARQRAAERRR